MTVYYTGNSGRSTGPHLDFQVFNPQTGGYEDSSQFTQYLSVGDQPFAYEITSGFQPEGRVNPVDGVTRPHNGTDFAVPTGTAITIKGGKHLSTWDDEGGGRMSQYAVMTDQGLREFIMLHGNEQNKVTGSAAVTDYDFNSLVPAPTAPGTNGETPQVKAKEKAKSYKEMSKAQINAKYDELRNSDPSKAVSEGLKMHKAYFNKP
jgi:hypothetical protein